MFLKCGYLSAREILRMIRTNRTTNYPALGKKCRIVDVESRDAVYRSTTVTDIGPCAPKTRACSISAVFDGPQSCRNEVGRIADGVFPGQFGDSLPCDRDDFAYGYRTVGSSGAAGQDQSVGVFLRDDPGRRCGCGRHADSRDADRRIGTCGPQRGRLRFGRDEDQRSHFIRRISDRRRLPAHRP